MSGDGLYLTTYECALAVVATSMKKARLSLDVLIVNSFIGGVLFTAGGMLHVMVQSESPQLLEQNPGILHLLQGLLYPIGLFYVVIMGVDLFNSNILFFSVGVARGAVSILDLVISWFVSWWFNLVGNIFVCYIVCHFSSISSSTAWVTGSVDILNEKLESNFVQTLLKAMTGNFFVCLAIYLQLMAKPVHVKLVLMVLPIFTFVSLGFTHSVADMFMIIIGLINGAPASVATVAWKLFLPGAIGNIIGGCCFSLIVPFFLHIVVVERDQRKLRLPRYDMRDQQPEINQDSRVVRAGEDEKADDTESDSYVGEPNGGKPTNENEYVSDGASLQSPSIMSRKKFLMRRSPSNVFPVYGMGPPGERERSIASGYPGEYGKASDTSQDPDPYEHRKSASFMGETLLRSISRTQSKRITREDSINDPRSTRQTSASRQPHSVDEVNPYFSKVAYDHPFRRDSQRASNVTSNLPPEALRSRSLNTVQLTDRISQVDAYESAQNV